MSLTAGPIAKLTKHLTMVQPNHPSKVQLYQDKINVSWWKVNQTKVQILDYRQIMTPITFQRKRELRPTHQRFEATSKNEASRDEKHFVVIAIFFLIFFNFALQLYHSLKKAF